MGGDWGEIDFSLSLMHEDDAGSCGAAGRRRQYAINANLGKICKGNRKPIADQL